MMDIESECIIIYKISGSVEIHGDMGFDLKNLLHENNFTLDEFIVDAMRAQIRHMKDLRKTRAEVQASLQEHEIQDRDCAMSKARQARFDEALRNARMNRVKREEPK